MPLAIFPRDHLAEAGWRGREALAGYDALIACGGAFAGCAAAARTSPENLLADGKGFAESAVATPAPRRGEAGAAGERAEHR